MPSIILGTLLVAASLSAQSPADPQLDNGSLRWLDLGLTLQQVQKLLGPPHLTAPFAHDFLSWQYRLGDDHHDPSHTLVFRRSTGLLVSITRSYDTSQSVAAFFPHAHSQSLVHHPKGAPPYPTLLRRLPYNTLLLAMGATPQRPATNQLTLIHRDALPAFFPWLIPLLEKPAHP